MGFQRFIVRPFVLAGLLIVLHGAPAPLAAQGGAIRPTRMMTPLDIPMDRLGSGTTSATSRMRRMKWGPG